MHKARSSYASYVSVNFVLTILFFWKPIEQQCPQWGARSLIRYIIILQVDSPLPPHTSTPYWILFDTALKWKTEHANINKVAGQCYNAIVSSLGWRPFIYTTLDNASPILCAYFLELLRHVIRRTRYIGLIPLQHKISLNCIHVTKNNQSTYDIT